MPSVYNNFNFQNDDHVLYVLMSSNHQMPGSVSMLMFLRCIDLMGTEEQVKKYYKKTLNL